MPKIVKQFFPKEMRNSCSGSHILCPCPQMKEDGLVNQILYLLKLDTSRKLGLVKDACLLYSRARCGKWNSFLNMNTTEA
jgi:hypothetical protein